MCFCTAEEATSKQSRTLISDYFLRSATFPRLPAAGTSPTDFHSGTHHEVGVGLHAARPHPGAQLADGAKAHAHFGVEGRLFVGAAHDDVLALGEVADATGVISQSSVLSNLRERREGNVN